MRRAYNDPLESRSILASQTEQTSPTIVLFHGAWADGSSWHGVIPSLQGDGELESSHASPVAQPRAVAELIERAAGA